MPDEWVAGVEERMQAFASTHEFVFRQTKRQVAASFEIGCFHALAEFYGRSFDITTMNLTSENEYRYLTSPNGNPANFSYLNLAGSGEAFELRQQVRIRSHRHRDIAFTPDLVVLRAGATVEDALDPSYAAGRRPFYSVDSDSVVAAHECKSMNPFPELLIGFIGMIDTAHKWRDDDEPLVRPAHDGVHLAPTLFVGGAARALHSKMIAALQQVYPMNIVVGLHAGQWSLFNREGGIRKLSVFPFPH